MHISQTRRKGGFRLFITRNNRVSSSFVYVYNIGYTQNLTALELRVVFEEKETSHLIDRREPS